MLREKGIVTDEQIQAAIELQDQNEDLRIGDALVQLEACTYDDVMRSLSELLDYPFVDLRAARIPIDAIEAVPKSVAMQHQVIPIAREDGTLTVAMSDPFDLYAMDNLRFMLNADVRCVLASPDALDEAINKFYGTEESTVDNMLQEFTDSDIGYDQAAEDADAEDEDEDAPLVRLVHLIIAEAVRCRASDIHVEPLESRLRIRYRIDGVCREIDAPPKKLQNAIISRIKIMSGIDIAEKRKPQDGRIAMRVGGKPLDLRVSALPANHGESVVLRLLEKESILVNLQELGFHDTDYKRFLSIIKRPNGIFLVTGPTGSGKTTTLYAALNELNRPDKKIITAEDPVEYSLAGINQAEVNAEIGYTFSNILRAMLRQAPNVILVGEIRDPDTAEIAIQAALTGHLVFSTLHTNDAPSSITRLIDMGIKPFLVASSIHAVMAQRLVRVICERCKEPIEYSVKELSSVNLRPEDVRNVTLYHGAGCSYCGGTGYRGRVAIFEMMEMDGQLREMTFRRETVADLRRQARIGGMKVLAEDGVRKVLAGVTTIEEIVRITRREEDAESGEDS